MHLAKIAALASIAAFAAAGSAFAQAPRVNEGQVIHVDPSGNTRVMKVRPRGHEALMQDARAHSNGVLVYRKNGKLHVVEDRMMPNNKMMSADDELFERAVGNIE